MNEENFDPKQSLLLIESMINRAKDKFAEDGTMYFLWGWVVFICSLTQFILMHFFKYPYHYLVWFASWIVVIYQVVYIRKKIKYTKSPHLYRLYPGLCMAHIRDRYFFTGIFDWQVNNRRILQSYQSYSAYHLWHSYFFVRNYFKI